MWLAMWITFSYTTHNTTNEFEALNLTIDINLIQMILFIEVIFYVHQC